MKTTRLSEPGSSSNLKILRNSSSFSGRIVKAGCADLFSSTAGQEQRVSLPGSVIIGTDWLNRSKLSQTRPPCQLCSLDHYTCDLHLSHQSNCMDLTQDLDVLFKSQFKSENSALSSSNCLKAKCSRNIETSSLGKEGHPILWPSNTCHDSPLRFGCLPKSWDALQSHATDIGEGHGRWIHETAPSEISLFGPGLLLPHSRNCGNETATLLQGVVSHRHPRNLKISSELQDRCFTAAVRPQQKCLNPKAAGSTDNLTTVMDPKAAGSTDNLTTVMEANLLDARSCKESFHMAVIPYMALSHAVLSHGRDSMYGPLPCSPLKLDSGNMTGTLVSRIASTLTRTLTLTLTRLLLPNRQLQSNSSAVTPSIPSLVPTVHMLDGYEQGQGCYSPSRLQRHVTVDAVAIAPFRSSSATSAVMPGSARNPSGEPTLHFKRKPMKTSSLSSIFPKARLEAAAGTVMPREVSAAGTVMPREVSAAGTVMPREVSAAGTVMPREVSAAGTVMPREVSAAGTVMPREVSAAGTVMPREVSAAGTVMPREVSADGTVMPREVSADGTTRSGDYSPSRKSPKAFLKSSLCKDTSMSSLMSSLRIRRRESEGGA
ncbi:hypothetical protein CEUSTIGMA_g2012.t1 [Chlamydomonas eustigma]|uniref:Uncharacterized protein n=1 Tax=Chlamydomonas eustigma TaxID=1157962 RepID=A0A250WUP3_9CHLO|nr:hypothetical protein CEUSTIGMA_g2012.t1 [Chlamydomonas eustigma]|eukprot:GAX74563.1 hypothetical protein CEUSTIGMA_g2012.t1 [Chlamydomonas eustigma]